MLTWHYVTSTEYNAASTETKTADKLYFLSDTKQIYRGTELFTEACSLVAEYPATPAVGRLYILSTTLEGKIYNGTAWQTVIQPVQATVDANDTAKPVSGKAVADYVTDAIADVTGDASGAVKNAAYGAGQKLTFTKNDETTFEVEITDLPVDLVYDSDSGLLQLKDNDGNAVGTGINLDLERFVKSGSYDPNTKKITLVFNDEADPVEIDASALVDVYTGAESTSATVTVGTDNTIKAEVKLATKSDNALSVDADGGLYVAPTNLDAYATTAAVNEIKAALETSIAAAQKAADDEKVRAEAAEAALDTRLTTAEGKLTVVQGDETTDGSIKKALADAKAYTDEKNTAMDTRVKAVEATSHEHANKAELDLIATGDKAKWDKAVTDLASEISRATAAEKANADDIDAIEAVLEWKTSV